MKNLKNILIIVFVVVALVTVAAVSYQAMIVAPKAAEQKNVLKQYNFPETSNPGSAPSNGFSATAGTGDSLPEGADPEVNEMLQSLEEASDDGGASEIQQLETEVQGL